MKLIESLAEISDNSIGLVVIEMTDTVGYEQFREYARILETGRRLVVLCEDSFDGRNAEIEGDFRSARAVGAAKLAEFRVRQHLIWNNPKAGESWLAGKGFPHGPAVVVNQTFRDIWVFQKTDTWVSHLARYAPLEERLEAFDVMDRKFFLRWMKNPLWEGSAAEVYTAMVRMWSRPGDVCLGQEIEFGRAVETWHRQARLVASGQPAENLRRAVEKETIMLAGASALWM